MISSGIGSGTISLTGSGGATISTSSPSLGVVAGLDRLAVDLDQSFVDQPLHAVAREVGDAVHQVLVDPARQILANAKIEVFDIRALIALDVFGRRNGD